MSKIAFVQKNKIPPSPAPISEVGFIGWLKQNLFSSWFNTLLTLLSIYFIFIILKDPIMKFIIRSKNILLLFKLLYLKKRKG